MLRRSTSLAVQVVTLVLALAVVVRWCADGVQEEL